MTKNAIYIAATGQNVGKTTLCLGIIACLQKRFPSVGFIKPVGQQHLKVEDGIMVDKDAVLFKEHFHLPSSWSDMSPVIIPSGFTRKYLDEQFHSEELLKQIKSSFKRISNNNAYTIVEGTGHVGVGSIIDLNNAKVAAELGLDMVIIASGGLGSSYDQLAQNIALCREYGVKVRGIILNRVHDSKRGMILDYFPKALKKWGVPLIGCIPYNAFLSKPTMKDFENLFNTTLISGKQHHYRHFIQKRLVAGSLDAYMQDMVNNELIITPATREDIIEACIDQHEIAWEEDRIDMEGGMILTGRHPPSDTMIEKIQRMDVPVLYASPYSYDAMKMITSFIAKIRMEDLPKIEQAISLTEENLNFDLLCGSCLT